MTSLAHGLRRTPPAPRPTERFEQDTAAAIGLTGELACGRDGACTSAEIGDVFAGPRPTWHCRETATAAHTPLLDAHRTHRVRVAVAFLLAIACDALGDPDAIERAAGRAFDLTGTGKMLFPFPLPAPGCPATRPGTAPPARHRSMRPWTCWPEWAGQRRPASCAAASLRPRGKHGSCYLPSNLSAREIADELYLSMNAVRTHQRHLYRKLGARTALRRAREIPARAEGTRSD